MQTSTIDTNLEVNGLTEFGSHPNTEYRFVLKLKDEKINIWLEDRDSKKQWCVLVILGWPNASSLDL